MMNRFEIARQKRLIKRIKNGDSEAFATLWESLESNVRGQIRWYRVRRYWMDEDEALQRVRIKFWEWCGRWRGECALTSWVYQIAAWELQMMTRFDKADIKRRGRLKDVLGPTGIERYNRLERDDPDEHPVMVDEVTPERLSSARERLHLVNGHLARMQPDWRRAVFIHSIAGESYKSASDREGVTLWCLKSRAWRGREWLLKNCVNA